MQMENKEDDDKVKVINEYGCNSSNNQLMQSKNMFLNMWTFHFDTRSSVSMSGDAATCAEMWSPVKKQGIKSQFMLTWKIIGSYLYINTLVWTEEQTLNQQWPCCDETVV